MTGCRTTKKKRFNTQEDAQDAMKGIRKHPNETIPCRWYPCRFCKGFHLTSQAGHNGAERPVTNKAFKKYLAPPGLPEGEEINGI